jgi:spore maturation protein CgeB
MGSGFEIMDESKMNLTKFTGRPLGKTLDRGGVRVIVSGSFPDRMNSNLVLRGYLAEGLRECLGVEAVLNVPLDTLPAAVHLHQPELVLCFGSCPPEVTNFAPLRDACDATGSHLAIWLHDDPYEFDLNFSATDVADTIFSNDRWATIHYDHPRAFHLPLAANRQVHYRDWVDAKDTDVFFCGVAFANRKALLKDLAPVLSNHRTAIYGDGWPEKLPGVINRRIPNSELADRCALALTTLYMGRNLHFANRRYQLDPSTPGPRFFEAAMSGTVQMVFAESLEVLDYFQPEEGILLYDDPMGFGRHLERLREEPMFAREIVRAGQYRAIKEHTYTVRACRLLELCGLDVKPFPLDEQALKLGQKDK